MAPILIPLAGDSSRGRLRAQRTRSTRFRRFPGRLRAQRTKRPHAARCCPFAELSTDVVGGPRARSPDLDTPRHGITTTTSDARHRQPVHPGRRPCRRDHREGTAQRPLPEGALRHLRQRRCPGHTAGTRPRGPARRSRGAYVSHLSAAELWGLPAPGRRTHPPHRRGAIRAAPPAGHQVTSRPARRGADPPEGHSAVDSGADLHRPRGVRTPAGRSGGHRRRHAQGPARHDRFDQRRARCAGRAVARAWRTGL